MAFYIQHKTDSSYDPWYASGQVYAIDLFMAILNKNPHLIGHLEIVMA